jgi:chromosome segregation ATPase
MDSQQRSGLTRSLLLTPYSLLLLISLTACANDGGIMPDPAVEAARRHADMVVRDARAEAAALRAEMASTRIDTAKKEAEVRELQRELARLRLETSQARQETGDLRRTRIELQQGAEAKQAELFVLRSERDRLVQTKEEMQAQLAELPKLRQTVTEAATAQERLQVRVQELESSLAAMATEITQMRASLGGNRQKSAAKPPKRSATETKPADPTQAIPTP